MNIEEYIDNAIKTGKSIHISYQKHDGTCSQRTVSNLSYSDEFGDGYIHGFCHLRQEDRTFKISRISDVDGISNHKSSNRTYGSSSNVSIQRDTHNYRTPQTTQPTSRTSYQSSNKSEGCYIATMAYGDYNHPKVIILRDYRDNTLKKSFFGRIFIKTYYFCSPKLVSILRGHKKINIYIRSAIDCYLSNKGIEV